MGFARSGTGGRDAAEAHHDQHRVARQREHRVGFQSGACGAGGSDGGGTLAIVVTLIGKSKKPLTVNTRIAAIAGETTRTSVPMGKAANVLSYHRSRWG